MASSAIMAAAGAQAIKMADSALDKSSEKILAYLTDKTKDARDLIIAEFRIGFQVLSSLRMNVAARTRLS